MTAKKPAKKKVDPTGRVVKEIAVGRHDGGIEEILAAVRERMADVAGRIMWRVTIDGHMIDEDTLLLREHMALEEATGKSWQDIHPLVTATDAYAVISLVLREHSGLSSSDADERLAALTSTEAVGCVEQVVRIPAPLDSPN